MPANIEKFLYDYKNSKFIECDHEMAQKLKASSNYTENEERNMNIRKGLVKFSEVMDSLFIPYSLFGGTLLGWYRDCGIIPHTTDVDLAVRYEDYDIRVKKAFLGNRRLRLLRTFGNHKNGLELRLHNSHFQFDLFLCYKVNSTHMWVPYHGNFKLYK